MANQWVISHEVELIVQKRDTKCVCCKSEFEHESHKTTPTWKHIINNLEFKSDDNIALCCFSCNASKGSKLITTWFDGDYCMRKGISSEIVARVVQEAINNLGSN